MATNKSANIVECTDEEFIKWFPTLGATKLAKKLNTSDRVIYARRRRIESEYGIYLKAPTATPLLEYPGRYQLGMDNGTILVGSDFHVWPGEESVCLTAFKYFVDQIKPDAIVLNGDVLDFPRISRFPTNWGDAPDPAQEIECAQDHLSDITARSKRGAHRIWTRGNHDIRFEVMLANAAPAFKNVMGTRLGDHFATWEMVEACYVNGGTPHATMIKHRYKGGKHAIYNNVKDAGTHMVTGHLHAQNIRAITDYREIDLYGVDTGCVAAKNHLAFLYTENSPLDWREGFALLSFNNGQLMYPELFTRWDAEHVQFRGQLHRVKPNAQANKDTQPLTEKKKK